jgi:hypothetical protein
MVSEDSRNLGIVLRFIPEDSFAMACSPSFVMCSLSFIISMNFEKIPKLFFLESVLEWMQSEKLDELVQVLQSSRAKSFLAACSGQRENNPRRQ